MPKTMSLTINSTPTSTVSLGEALAGTYSAVTTGAITNTNDTPLTGMKFWLLLTVPGGARVTIGGVPIVGTSRETATSVPDLAPGASHAVIIDAPGPAAGRVTSRLRGEAF